MKEGLGLAGFAPLTVLATTVGAEVCTDAEILEAYQEQHTTVEPGFRWIKNPAAIAPVWLQQAARWNPFSWATDGTRALFRGETADPAVWQGFTIVAVLALVTIGWSARLFSRTIR